MNIDSIIAADCRVAADKYAPVDLIIADPPYGDTSLDWDVRLEDWPYRAIDLLKLTGSMWVFGSMRYFLSHGPLFEAAGFRFAQDIVWEKQNGSGFSADRFKRVHEHAAQFYPATSAWKCIFNEVQRTARFGPDKSGARRRQVPPSTGVIHTGAIAPKEYRDDGTRIMRSVITMQNMQGRAIHPTEKPSDLIEILIRTSCPPGGLVLDLFAGSGSAGEAAMRAGRRYVGFEIDPAMAEKANARLGSLLPITV